MNQDFALQPNDRFTFQNDTGSLLNVVCTGKASGVTLTVLMPAGASLRLERANEPFTISCMHASGPGDDADIAPGPSH